MCVCVSPQCVSTALPLRREDRWCSQLAIARLLFHRPFGETSRASTTCMYAGNTRLTESKRIRAAHLFGAWFKIRKKALPLAVFLFFLVGASDLDMVDSKLPSVFIWVLLCSCSLTNQWFFLFYNNIIIKYLLLLFYIRDFTNNQRPRSLLCLKSVSNVSF